jgi:hypothetical protein
LRGPFRQLCDEEGVTLAGRIRHLIAEDVRRAARRRHRDEAG